MKPLVKKDFYQLRRNQLLLTSLVAIMLMGTFGAKSYTLDLTIRHDAIGIFDAMVFDSTIIVILATLIISSLIGSEFKNRTIHHDIYSGHSRRHILSSKIAAYLVAYNLLILAFPITGYLRMLPVLGLETTVAGSVFHIIKIVLYSIVLNSAMYSFCLFIAFLCRDIGETLALSAVYILSFALLMAYGKPAGLFDKIAILNFIPLIEIRYIVSEKLAHFDLFLILFSALTLFSFFTFMTDRVFQKADLR